MGSIDELAPVELLGARMLTDRVGVFDEFGSAPRRTEFGHLFVSRWDDAAPMFRPGCPFRAATLSEATLGVFDCGSFDGAGGSVMLFAEGDGHARLRAIADTVMARDRVAALTPVLRATVDREVRDRLTVGVDFGPDVAAPALRAGFAEFMGIGGVGGAVAEAMGVLPKLFTFEAGVHRDEIVSAVSAVASWASTVRDGSLAAVRDVGLSPVEEALMSVQLVSGGWDTLGSQAANIAATGGFDGPVSGVVSEGLRLWPSSWAVRRVASAGSTVAGVDVGEGMMVTAATPMLGRDVSRWVSPRVFDPGRRWRASGAANRSMPRAVSYLPAACGSAADDGVRLALATFGNHVRMDHYRQALAEAGVVVGDDWKQTFRGALDAGMFAYGSVDDIRSAVEEFRAAGVSELVLNLSGVYNICGGAVFVRQLDQILTSLADVGFEEEEGDL